MLRGELVLPSWQTGRCFVQSVCMVEMSLDFSLGRRTEFGMLDFGQLRGRSSAGFLGCLHCCLMLLLRMLSSHHRVHRCMVVVLRNVLRGCTNVEVIIS